VSENHNRLLRSLVPIPLEMEQCPCPICEGDSTDTLLEFDSFGFPTRTVECQYCGLIYVNPRPTSSYVREFYVKHYRYFYEGIREVSEAFVRRRRWREWAQYRLAKYAPYLTDGVKLLDVGCGIGLFLNAVRERFPRATLQGVEPDPMVASYAQRHLGLDVQPCFLDGFWTSETFDVISVFHVLEHLHDLPGFFRFVKQHLRPGGLVIAESPNADGSWEGIGMFHLLHLTAFSPRSMSNLFLLNGFHVLAGAGVENDLEHSNLYVVARLDGSGESQLLPRDLEESARLRAKCQRIRQQRWWRVCRTWMKIGYYEVAGPLGRDRAR